MKQSLTDRVRHVLRELAVLSEAPASSSLEAKTSSSKPGSRVLRSEETAYGHYADKLEKWCKDAEDRVRKVRKGQADDKGQLPELTTGQVEHYVLREYVGLDYRHVADKVDLDPKEVYQIRLRFKVDGRTGRPKQ